MMRNVLRTTSTTEWIAVLDIAWELAGRAEQGADRVIEQSVRRACKRLAAQGHVELAYRALRTGKMRAEWPGQRAELMVRKKSFARPAAGQRQPGHNVVRL